MLSLTLSDCLFLFLVLLVPVGILFCLSVVLTRWNELRYCRKGVPPGTVGWPILGETTEFLKQGPEFMKSQSAKYGSFFKSHLLWSPTIVSMDPEVNRYILLNESEGLVPAYPKSMVDILGNRNIASIHGSAHKYMRGGLLSIVNPAMIKEHLLSATDSFMRSHLAGWEDTVVDLQEKTKEMVFLSTLNQLCGAQPAEFTREFMSEFFHVFRGTFALPFNFPGTRYRRGLQARKNIVSMTSKLMEERRRACPSPSEFPDGLSTLMRTDDEYKFKSSDDQIIDQVITLLYSGFETVSTTTMMAVKYLHDNPLALLELRREHLEIRARKKEEDPIDWNDLKSMSFSRAVILETLRLATVVNGVLRKVTKDMELNGFFIPKGWKIYVYTREMHYDSSSYPEPHAFNPWRWLDNKEENKSSNLMFGKGTRVCPGKELGIAEISTFLHYFVTRYRWEEIGGGGDKLVKFPRVTAPNGLHIRVSSY